MYQARMNRENDTVKPLLTLQSSIRPRLLAASLKLLRSLYCSLRDVTLASDGCCCCRANMSANDVNNDRL